MADRETIARVAKILARATSPEPGEAAAALNGAYKRMIRDGVTLQDLLSLPVSELYQNTLTRLADIIVENTPGLSPSERREAYRVYLERIVAKFTDTSSRAGQGGTSRGDGSDRSQERDEYRRRYEEQTRDRQRQEDVGRARQANEESRENGKTGTRENGKSTPGPRGFRFSFADRRYFFNLDAFTASLRESFGAGTLWTNAFRHPAAAARLFLASALWGAGFAGVVIVTAAFGHALIGHGPLIDIRLRLLFTVLTAVGTVWKAGALSRAGWFDRHRW